MVGVGTLGVCTWTIRGGLAIKDWKDSKHPIKLEPDMSAHDLMVYLINNVHLSLTYGRYVRIPIKTLPEHSKIVMPALENDTIVCDQIQRLVGHGDLTIWARAKHGDARLATLDPDVFIEHELSLWEMEIILIRERSNVTTFNIRKRNREGDEPVYVDAHFNFSQVKKTWPPQWRRFFT